MCNISSTHHMNTSTKNAIFYIALLFFSIALPASAHTMTGATGGFSSGFLHPLAGLDHIVAMVAVGLWGAFLRRPALWMLPVVFPLIMAIGGALGVAGMPLPGTEIGIALSGVVLGTVVAAKIKPPLWVALMLVAFFALFHGHAHGAELPDAANPITFAIGFVLATGLLHLIGIGFGYLTKWRFGEIAVRSLGMLVVLIGFGFLFGLL